MIRIDASRSLGLLMSFVVLASCGQHPSVRQAAPSDIEEARADIAAVRNNPSLTDPAKYAGPPIHVDPYPKSSGMHGGNGHAGMTMK
jgi:hypothetical protein